MERSKLKKSPLALTFFKSEFRTLFCLHLRMKRVIKTSSSVGPLFDSLYRFKGVENDNFSQLKNRSKDKFSQFKKNNLEEC